MARISAFTERVTEESKGKRYRELNYTHFGYAFLLRSDFLRGD